MENFTRLFKQYSTLLLASIMVVGAFLRFYNLNWGAPYYFHPDERNIASSVSQLHFPDQMNPHFFAYGSLPIYTFYFTGLFINLLSYCPHNIFSCTPNHLVSSITQLAEIKNVSFESTILISRFYSAFLSSLLIFFLYKLGKTLYSRKVGLITAFFATTSVGLIQFAHFGTFEMWITFFSILLFYVCIQIIQRANTKKTVLAGVLFGVLIAIKVSNLVLCLLPIISLFFALFPHIKSSIAHKKKIIATYFIQISILFSIAAIIYTLTNPFAYIDFKSFQDSLHYESGVALGTIPVFYTQEFYETVPVLYQFLHVYPFLMNPLLTVLFIPSFLYFIWKSIKMKNSFHFILAICYLLIFLSQAVLFVKWIRYMVPTLPFIYLIIAPTIVHFTKTLRKMKWNLYVLPISAVIIAGFSVMFCLSYVVTVLIPQDTRIAASQWAQNHMNSEQSVTSEVYDIGVTAFNGILPNITLCDFYNLETNPLPCNGESLQSNLAKTRYVLLPSQRILQSRLSKPSLYPVGHRFYSLLLQEMNGYHKIYETPCDMFCQILYLGDPVLSYEQTASVFDRPTVFIFEKQ